MPRMLRIAGSLAIVLVAYGAYRLLAVPLIEPAADVQQGKTITERDRAGGSTLVEGRLAQWKDLFEPDAWELKKPKILESHRITLLMQDYRNLGEGRVEITPCTLIFMPKGPFPNQAQRRRQAVILQAPEGALLEFDGPLDLRRVKIGRLKSGKLRGPVKIRSQGKKPGPDDDLMIVTRDVELTERLAWTPHPVDFRLGPNYGRGHQMRIELMGVDKSRLADPRGPNITGIKSFELQRVERLHLELGQAKLVPGKKAATKKTAAKEPGAGKPILDAASDLPVEITCRGAFRFDNVKKVATFQDQVDVLRINPTGPSDQLNCELLSVFFVDRAAAKPGSKPAAAVTHKTGLGSIDLRPQRIEARGNPVVVSAPSEGAHARGERLQYDLQTNRIVLDGTHQVMLRQGPNEIHARSLEYQSAGPGRLGRIVSQGPGWLRGQLANRPDQQLEAWWNKQLHVRPHEKNQVISLTGGARLNFRGMSQLNRTVGQLEAGEIHFWLLESPAKGPSDQARLRANRMLARDDVRVNSPQLSGTVEQLEVWFEYPAAGPGSPQKPATVERQADKSSGRCRRAGLVLTSYRPLPQREFVTAGKPVGWVEARGPHPGLAGCHGQTCLAMPYVADVPEHAHASVGMAPNRQQRFHVVGRLLQARVLVKQDQKAEISELMVEDGAKFIETQTAEPDERPLLVTGERLHVVDAGKPHAAVTVIGRPAHFEARGLGLTGPNINLNRGTNRLWVDGPGRMDVPMDRDLEGRPLPTPEVLNVYWRDRMTFDGRTARFEASVTAVAPRRRLETETLEVQFKRPVRFSETKLRENPDVEKLLCRGNVSMENRELDKHNPQIQTSYQRMQVVDLAINRTSGALTAGGPGWISSVRRGSDDLLGISINANNRRTPATAGGGDNQLRGLYVRFQGSITGNLHRREMTFHHQVRTTYAPVDAWNATLDTSDPDVLGPGGVVMHCDRLTVNEMASPAGNHRELEAAGNIVIEGNREDSSFTARAVRMTYAEVKDLLVLEGDGWTDAELFRQQQIGGPTSKAAARKILYWPGTNRLQVDRARSLELSRFSAGGASGR